MKSLLRAVLAGVLVCAGWITETAVSSASEVVVIPIKGEISSARFFFLRRALKEAERQNAQAILLDMDTYGGELEACKAMQKALAQTKRRTLTYINPNAGSAGALIAISTQEIYMAPVSAIGAAAPITATGQDLTETLKDKQVSFLSSYFASVAENNGHNPEIAEAFINKNKTVVIGGQTIHEKGSVLTLSAQEAVKRIEGKPVLAEGIAPSINDLLKQAKLEGVVRRVEPTGFEVLAFWVTALSPLFLLGGILGAYIEIKIPGFGIAGITSALCFAIFFMGHYVAGLAGWEAPVLFLIGLALLLSELFLHPGTILPGLLGAALIVTSLVWTMMDRYPGSPLLPQADMLLLPLLNLSIAIALSAIGIFVLAKYLPKTPFFKNIVLSAQNPAGPALPKRKSEFTQLPVGAEGITCTILRPSGKAEFSGTLHDVITGGQFVNQGVRVRVIAVEGARIVVEEIG